MAYTLSAGSAWLEPGRDGTAEEDGGSQALAGGRAAREVDFWVHTQGRTHVVFCPQVLLTARAGQVELA